MSRFAISSALLILASACSTVPAVSTASHRVHSVDNARIQGLHVPAGSTVSVRLTQPIGTTFSAAGEQFTAVVQRPLVDVSGITLVHAGSRITGRISSTVGMTGPRIHLTLDRIESIAGPLPLSARLQSSNAEVYAGQPEYSMVLIGDDSLLAARHADASQRAHTYAGLPIGGGPSGTLYRVYRPREVIVPAGATLDFVLTRPLLAPGTFILRR